MSSDATFDVDPRFALVCVDDAGRQATVRSALDALGYQIHAGADSADVIDRLRKMSYELIVIDEAFHGSTALDHPALKAIQWMPMASRRSVLVALLGAAFTTFDNMSAFTKSVNLVIGYADLGQLEAIVRRGIAENDRFYQVLRQALQEVGKS